VQVREILDRKGHQVFAVRPEWRVRDAAAVIARRNIGTTVVTDPNGRLLGIVSERDIVRALCEAGREVFDLAVSAVMTATVVTCPPEATIGEALSLMASHRIRHVPVVYDNAVVGLISIRDVLEFRLESLEESFAALLRGKREASIARAAAERAEHSRAEFLVRLSGTIKPALHSITDLAEYLQDTLFEIPGGCNHLQNLEEIGANGRAALEILDHALDFARIASQEREPIRECIAVPRLIGGCADAIREPAALKGVTIDVTADDAVPILAADRLMVCQMLHHLLSNAVKFTPQGGTVTVACTADPDGGVWIVVSDTGIGMAPEQLARVTQPFYQVERLTTRGQDSVRPAGGLGLSLVDAMMRAHNGTLRLESRVGIGTAATLCFPPAPAPAAEAQAAD
jgi:signal transduction histidine kinase